MLRRICVLSTFMAILAPVPAVLAHHSIAPNFDTTQEFVLEGTVTDWVFVNPHVYVHLEVRDADGEITDWRCESTAAAVHRRNGFSEDTFEAGDAITVRAHPAKRDTDHCSINAFIFEDGSVVGRSDELPAHLSQRSFLANTTDASRPHYLPDGRPNLGGHWVPAPRTGPRTRTQFNVTDAGKSVQDDYVQIYDDPALHCDIANIFFGWRRGGITSLITQDEDKVVLLYGYMDFERTIHLDMADHPDDIVPSRGGHSIGRWEGETLVVDTIGFADGILHPLSGVPNSTAMHTVEKFRFDNETRRLHHSFVAEDPLYLADPYVGEDVMVLSDLPYQPYDCTELSGANNQRPDV